MTIKIKIDKIPEKKLAEMKKILDKRKIKEPEVKK